MTAQRARYVVQPAAREQQPLTTEEALTILTELMTRAWLAIARHEQAQAGQATEAPTTQTPAGAANTRRAQ